MRRVLSAPALALAVIAALVALGGSGTTGPAFAASSCVNPGGTHGCYASIQAAVNAAQPGANIDVEEGTYTQQVTITKNLTLSGSGERSTLIKTPTTLTPDAHGNFVDLEVGGGAIVTVHDLGVTGLGPAVTTCANAMFGLYVLGGATLHMRDARVTDTHNVSSPGCPLRGAVRVGSAQFLEKGTGDFDDVKVSGYEGAGINAQGPASTGGSVLFVRNSKIRTTPSTVIASVGIWIQTGATGSVINNNISGNECNAPGCGPDPAANYLAAGIDVSSNSMSGIEIRDNEVFDNDIGISGAYNHTLMGFNGNYLHNNRYVGIELLGGGTYHLNENLIRGSNIGVAIVTDSAAYGPAKGTVTASLRANTIKQNQTGILLKDTNTGDAFVPALTAHDNIIRRNSAAGLQNATTQVPDVRNNYWGSDDGPTNPANPGGNGDKIVGPASFIPFLTERP